MAVLYDCRRDSSVGSRAIRLIMDSNYIRRSMAYVPDDWKTSAYEHNVYSRKAGLFRKILTCTCGLSGWNATQLWNEHVRVERDMVQWLIMVETKKTSRLSQQMASRQANLQKYEEFKKSLQQTDSPDSASFYR